MPDGTRYDDDFLLWTQEQASLLRAERAARSNIAIDWENLADEIETLGRSQQRELATRLIRTLEHLLKLAFSTATAPRNGWIDTVKEQRREIMLLIKQNPSLKSTVAATVDEIAGSTRQDTAEALARYGEDASAAAVLSGAYPEVEMRVLDRDFIPHPPDPSTSV